MSTGVFEGLLLVGCGLYVVGRLVISTWLEAIEREHKEGQADGVVHTRGKGTDSSE